MFVNILFPTFLTVASNLWRPAPSMAGSGRLGIMKMVFYRCQAIHISCQLQIAKILPSGLIYKCTETSTTPQVTGRAQCARWIWSNVVRHETWWQYEYLDWGWRGWPHCVRIWLYLWPLQGCALSSRGGVPSLLLEDTVLSREDVEKDIFRLRCGLVIISSINIRY